MSQYTEDAYSEDEDSEETVECRECGGDGEVFGNYPDPQTLEICRQCDGYGYHPADQEDRAEAAAVDAWESKQDALAYFADY